MIPTLGGTRVRVLAPVLAHSTDAADQLTANGTTTYSCDANGNLSSATDASGTMTSYAYDAQIWFSQVTKGTTALSSYGYDAFGRTVTRTDAKGNSRYVYDGGNPLLAQPTTTGTSAREFLPGAGGLPAGVFQVNGANAAAQTVNYYQRDGQGSVVRTVGTDGAQLNSVGGYDAWGHPSSVSDSSDGYGLPLGYLGLPYDNAAGVNVGACPVVRCGLRTHAQP